MHRERAAGYSGCLAPPQFSRRATVCLLKCVIKTSDAAEPRRHRNIAHRQRRLVNQTFRKMQALCVRHRLRARAQMLAEEATQVATRYPEPVRQVFEVTFVQGTLGD